MSIANQVQKAVDGTTEVLFERVELTVSCTATWLSDDDRLQFKEFLSSVAAGESFSLDPYGTASNPSGTLYTNCRLTSSSVTPVRTTGPGVNQKFDITFNFTATVI